MAPFLACLLRLFLTQFQIYEGVLITARKDLFREIEYTQLTVCNSVEFPFFTRYLQWIDPEA